MEQHRQSWDAFKVINLPVEWQHSISLVMTFYLFYSKNISLTFRRDTYMSSMHRHGTTSDSVHRPFQTDSKEFTSCSLQLICYHFTTSHKKTSGKAHEAFSYPCHPMETSKGVGTTLTMGVTQPPLGWSEGMSPCKNCFDHLKLNDSIWCTLWDKLSVYIYD